MLLIKSNFNIFAIRDDVLRATKIRLAQNSPPTGVFLVPKLTFLAKIFTLQSRS